MRRLVAFAFAAAMVSGAAAPVLAGESTSKPVQQSVAPEGKAGGHSGGGCYEEYPASTKPNA